MLNKKIIIPIIIITATVIAVLMLLFNPNINKEKNNIATNSEIENIIIDNKKMNNTITENEVENMGTIYIKVKDQILDVKLEDNSATKELKEKLRNGDIIIQANEYGGFEKVGNLEFSLPREDKSITTMPGDIVLYQGNQISVFYNSNSWSYTRLGKIQNISTNELKNILGDGGVTLIFTIYR